MNFVAILTIKSKNGNQSVLSPSVSKILSWLSYIIITALSGTNVIFVRSR